MTSSVAASKPIRPYEIWGNWKMNPQTVEQATELAVDIATELELLLEKRDQHSKPNVGIFVPHGYLLAMSKLIVSYASNVSSLLQIGAQTMHYKESGAFTGEHSPTMIHSLLTSLNARPTVLIGHSERRQMFGETDICVNKKMIAAYEHDIRPFMCIGETLEERETGSTNSVLERQLRMGLADISAATFANAKTVIAYEPVWAIGTGKTATPQIANDAHAHVRSVLADMFTQGFADQTSIQYGGSMKPENATELLAMEHVDGGLIGGAALSAKSFLGIVRAVPS